MPVKSKLDIGDLRGNSLKWEYTVDEIDDLIPLDRYISDEDVKQTIIQKFNITPESKLENLRWLLENDAREMPKVVHHYRHECPGPREFAKSEYQSFRLLPIDGKEDVLLGRNEKAGIKAILSSREYAKQKGCVVLSYILCAKCHSYTFECKVHGAHPCHFCGASLPQRIISSRRSLMKEKVWIHAQYETPIAMRFIEEKYVLLWKQKELLERHVLMLPRTPLMSTWSARMMKAEDSTTENSYPLSFPRLLSVLPIQIGGSTTEDPDLRQMKPRYFIKEQNDLVNYLKRAEAQERTYWSTSTYALHIRGHRGCTIQCEIRDEWDFKGGYLSIQRGTGRKCAILAIVAGEVSKPRQPKPPHLKKQRLEEGRTTSRSLDDMTLIIVPSEECMDGWREDARLRFDDDAFKLLCLNESSLSRIRLSELIDCDVLIVPASYFGWKSVRRIIEPLITKSGSHRRGIGACKLNVPEALSKMSNDELSNVTLKDVHLLSFTWKRIIVDWFFSCIDVIANVTGASDRAHNIEEFMQLKGSTRWAFSHPQKLRTAEAMIIAKFCDVYVGNGNSDLGALPRRITDYGKCPVESMTIKVDMSLIEEFHAQAANKNGNKASSSWILTRLLRDMLAVDGSNPWLVAKHMLSRSGTTPQRKTAMEVLCKDMKSHKCSRCVRDFDEDEIAILACGHLFHKRCFSGLSKCPVCGAGIENAITGPSSYGNKPGKFLALIDLIDDVLRKNHKLVVITDDTRQCDAVGRCLWAHYEKEGDSKRGKIQILADAVEVNVKYHIFISTFEWFTKSDTTVQRTLAACARHLAILGLPTGDDEESSIDDLKETIEGMRGDEDGYSNSATAPNFLRVRIFSYAAEEKVMMNRETLRDEREEKKKARRVMECASIIAEPIAWQRPRIRK